MANRVNPPKQLVLPQSISENVELKKAFDDRDFILFQLWKRVGGGDDIIDNTEQAITGSNSRVSRNAARIHSLELKDFEIVNTTVGIITDRNQIIICKNTDNIDITLDTQALEEDEVHIKRRDKEVRVIGIIDGLTNKTINIKNYSMHLVFDGIDWSEI